MIRIHVAPLRERRDDIPGLFAFFAGLVSEQYGLPPRRLTREGERLLMAYPWPGNVRELKNVVERLAVKAPGEPVEARDLPEECRLPESAPRPRPTSGSSNVLAFQFSPLQPVTIAEPTADGLLHRMIEGGESFWTAVHVPFMSRDLSRDQLRAVVRSGLEQTCGNYRMLVELFNMPSDDYKRFLSFLRKHDCHVPFQPFRAMRGRSLARQLGTDEDRREAAAV